MGKKRVREGEKMVIPMKVSRLLASSACADTQRAGDGRCYGNDYFEHEAPDVFLFFFHGVSF